MFKQYSEEFRAKVVKRSEEIGNRKAAIEFNVPENTVYKWRVKARKNAQDTDNGESQKIKQTVYTTTSEESVKYNDELIKRVLMRAEESGVKMAAFEFSIPLEKVEEWVEKDKAEKAAKEDKTGELETKEEKITESSTQDKEPKKRPGRYSSEFKARVLKRVEEIGLKEAAAELIVPAMTVEKWVKAAEKESKAGEVVKAVEAEEPIEVKAESAGDKRTRRYSDEFKQQVVTRAAEIGLSKAAAEFDVTINSLRKWRMNFKDIADDVESVENTTAAVEIPVEDDKVETTKTEKLIKRMSTQSMETENAVLKAENAALKEQVEKLRKAMLELM